MDRDFTALTSPGLNICGSHVAYIKETPSDTRYTFL